MHTTDDECDRIREDHRGLRTTDAQPDLSRLMAQWRAEAMAKVRAQIAKANKIAALVPAAATVAEREALCRELSSWDQGRRDVFARAAGANSPSLTTWGLVVGAVRERAL